MRPEKDSLPRADDNGFTIHTARKAGGDLTLELECSKGNPLDFNFGI